MNVHLVTSITGFPNGTAAAKRIKMIGKAFQLSGHNFDVYTNTLSDNNLNQSVTGSFEQIKFEYLHKTVKCRNSRFKKIHLFIKGVTSLFFIIQKFNPSVDVVYIYSQGTFFNVITTLYCKFFNVKVIQEINEWYHRELKRPVQTWITENPMIKWSNAAIVISHSIQEEVKKINLLLPTIIIPVLEDPEDYTATHSSPVSTNTRYIFWMGLVDGYFSDVEIIIQALALSQKQSQHFDFYVSGPFSEAAKQKAIKIAEDFGYDVSRFHLLGYISEESLMDYCRNAYAFIVPLWNNKRSEARFPTKIATFMFCGRPVLTCNIGEITRNLIDRENALFFNVGDADDLSAKINLLANDQNLYNNICTNALQLARDKFGYENYSDTINSLINSI